MLDSIMKRKIDTARDILVGKVPDPKSQVEQITIALIYKFMDDMDAEAEELGGKRKFFAGDFGRYAWTKLMAPGVGGHDLLGLYSEGIAKMTENSGIPPLFRDIFKNAYLPYRDPETLKSFLKIINEFSYADSESLGDAFEYLLSVLGSQGEAGQFRTPRHIIDLIVDIIDPKKGETILDPACGTAGFLISAYKHILKMNTGENINTLTPDEKGRLVQNFKGYDISPDMVRLSLVNLYLHGFAEPHIYEYDTLTAEDRWNEYADVILANPPFMSPKGGIKPHKRFSIQAKRSEVLFVDYIAEHLTPTGRAGVIVPEGVIFQSQSAYKDLRKMLVNNSLVAVISLPAGVFNPYSGVKTSILILDKSLAKQCDTIAFFKIDNDGYSLGAQRRATGGEQLTQTKHELSTYLAMLRNHQKIDESFFKAGLIIPKEKIITSGDYNLSGERYREKSPAASCFSMISLGEVCSLIGGGTPSKQEPVYWENGTVKWISSKHIDDRGGITDYNLISDRALEETSTRVAPKGSTIIITRVSVGKYAFADDSYAINQDLTALYPNENQLITPGFIRVIAPYIAKIVEHNAEGVGVRGVTRSFLSKLQIPLPSLEVQNEIVAEIEGYQKVIDGARAVIENYQPNIPINPKWPMVTLGDYCQIKGGKRLPKGVHFSNTKTNHPYIRVTDFGNLSVNINNLKYISEEVHEQIARYTISSSDVYISIAGTIGLIGTIPDVLNGANLTENAAKLIFDPSVFDKRFLAIVGNSDLVQSQVRSLTHAAGVPKLALERIKTLKFPLPSLTDQQTAVSEIEAEHRLINTNYEVMAHFDKKIQATLARVWGEAA